MLFRLFAVAALGIPTALAAQSPADTHERVTIPGKQLASYRPLIREDRMPACLPDWSKAQSCRSRQVAKQMEAVRLAKAERRAAGEMAQR